MLLLLLLQHFCVAFTFQALMLTAFRVQRAPAARAHGLDDFFDENAPSRGVYGSPDMLWIPGGPMSVSGPIGRIGSTSPAPYLA